MRDLPVTVGHVDGQNPNVVQHAVDEAIQQGRSLRVLHVVEGSNSDDSHEWPAESPDIQRLGGAVERVVRRGDAATVLLDECELSSCLVIGTDDPSLTPARWSEVAQQVALHATIPVIVVPEHQPAASTSNVLVAIDEAHDARGPLAYAIDIAERRGAGLDVVFGAGTLSDYPGRLAAELRLEDLIDPWRRAHPTVVIRVSVEGGHPADSCLAAATRASLLVVGRPAHKHPRVGSRSVASRIPRHATVPVAVVPLAYTPAMVQAPAAS